MHFKFIIVFLTFLVDISNLHVGNSFMMILILIVMYIYSLVENSTFYLLTYMKVVIYLCYPFSLQALCKLILNSKEKNHFFFLQYIHTFIDRHTSNSPTEATLSLPSKILVNSIFFVI